MIRPGTVDARRFDSASGDTVKILSDVAAFMSDVEKILSDLNRATYRPKFQTI